MSASQRRELTQSMHKSTGSYELVFSPLLLALIGYGLDRWLGTRPWATIVLFFLGVAAGMLNVYRAVAGIKTAVGYRRPDQIGAGRSGTKDKWDDDEE